MTIDVYIPAIGQQELLDQALDLMGKKSTQGDTDYIVIDNGSKIHLKPRHGYVIRFEENIGMLKSMEFARNDSVADILILTHSDMMIYQDGWDSMISEAFERDPKLGLLGLAGARIATADGGRDDTYTSFRNWQDHGKLTPYGQIIPCALLDGCFMAFRRSAMFEVGIPTRTDENGYFFTYDKDQSLTMTMASWHVGVIGIECEHLGGRTSCHEEFTKTLKYQTHDTMYQASEKAYIEKWKECFPVEVRADWTVHVGRK